MKLLMLIIKLLEPTPESCKDGFQQLPFTAIIVPPLGCQYQRLSITVTSLKYARNLGLLTSECSWFKNSLQIQPKRVSLLMTPSFSQHLSKFSQHKQNSLYIPNPSAFLIIEAAHFGCCRMNSLISAMETFGLHWSFF